MTVNRSGHNPSFDSVVLHIADAGRPAPTAGLEHTLKALQIPFENIADVYAGLVRILRKDSPPPAAVLVCVDDLPGEEFEFFELASQARRDLPIFVYGHPRNAPRLRKAIDAGAWGEATGELLEKIKARMEPTAQTAGERAPHRGAGQEAADLEVALARPVQESAAAPQDSDHAPDEKGEEWTAPEEAQSTARVPWLRYVDRPVRRGPTVQSQPEASHEALGVQHKNSQSGGALKPQETAGRSETSANGDAPPGDADLESDAGPLEDFGPLLSEEELAALLGDDYGQIGSPERQMLTGEGESEGGRR